MSAQGTATDGGLRARAARLLPGDGVVLRGPGAVVWASGDTVDAVLEQVAAAVEVAGSEPAPARRVLRRLAGVVSAVEPDELPALAAVVEAADGLAIMVVGDADVHVTGPDGDEVLRGRDAATWVDRVVDRDAATIVVTTGGAAAGVDDRWSDLREGSARAGGVVLTSPGATAGTARPASVAFPTAPAEDVAPKAVPEVGVDEETGLIPAPALGEAPDPVPPGPAAAPLGATAGVDFRSVSLLDVEPDESPGPLPVPDAGARREGGVLVEGIWCSRHHFNDPRAAYCSVCGISMVHQTHNLVEGPRPPLGVLVLDDGSTFGVAADYVVGREPEVDPAVAGGAVLPLVVDDPDRSVSRVHARVHLEGWDVRLTDAGSANGTYVAAPGTDDWHRLQSDEVRTLAPGTRIRLGQRELVFDSHHRA